MAILRGSTGASHAEGGNSSTKVLGKDTPIVHIASHFKLEPGNIANSYLLQGDGT